MKFEDTKLLDHKAVRAVYKKAQFESVMNNMMQPPREDKLKASVRAGEILHETIPSADPEQIAAAVLFLNLGFQEPTFVKRAHGRDLPKVCGWAQEWREAIGAQMHNASIELRQIVTAANIALIEELRNNLPLLDANNVRIDLVKIDLITRQTGNLQSPALEEKYKRVRGEIEAALMHATRLPKFLRRLGL